MAVKGGGAAESRLPWGTGRDTGWRTSPRPPATPYLLLGLHFLPPVGGTEAGVGPQQHRGRPGSTWAGPSMLPAQQPPLLSSFNEPSSQRGQRAVLREVTSQAISPSSRSPLLHLLLLKPPIQGGDPSPIPWGAQSQTEEGPNTNRQTGPRQTLISRRDKCKQRLSALREWEGRPD